MRYCFVVFTDPEHRFESIHRTIDGATAAAATCGVTRMPDGSAITIEAVLASLEDAAMLRLPCYADADADAVIIERHAIVL